MSSPTCRMVEHHPDAARGEVGSTKVYLVPAHRPTPCDTFAAVREGARAVGAVASAAITVRRLLSP